MFGGPLGGPDAAFRLVAQNYKSDGFRRNVFLNQDSTNGYDETTLRGKVHWGVTDELQLDLAAMYVNLDNGYDAWSIDNSRLTQSDDPGKDSQLSRAAAVHLQYSGLGSVVIQNITTLADSSVVNSFDGDWGNDAFWGAYAPYRYFLHNERKRRTLSEDLRFTAPATGDGTGLAWAAGVYVLHSRETNDELDFSDQVVYNTLHSLYTSTNYAAYGELDFNLTRKLRLSLGARVERREAHYADSNDVAFNPGDTMEGGHLSLDYALRDRSSLYVTLSRGYKAGGFNIDSSLPADLKQFKPEFLWNLETGYKTRTADGRFELQADVFYMRRTSEQVEQSFQPDPTDPLTFTIYNENAARGENYGLEGSISWWATRQLQIGGTLGLLQTRYLGYQSGGVSLDGREQSHAPPYQVSLFAQYRHPGGVTLRVDSQSVDSFYYDVANDQKSNPYTLVNLKLGYEQPRWSAYAWMRNAFNRYYAMRGFFFNDLPYDAPNQRYTQAGDPRQYGVTVNYSFR